jgi:geranylgeranyl diphosphate synthase type I
MEIEDLLEKHSEKIELYLAEIWNREVESASEYHPFIGGLYESMREFTLRGGKRMASFTTALVSMGYGYADEACLRAVCEAVELYRHSILVHDDLVDGDDLRRGKPTIHRIYGDMRDTRMGMGASVFSGNILFCMAMGRVLNSQLDDDVANRIGAEILRANTEVNESQTLDVYMEGAAADMELWKTMASKRAASLFRTTLRIGGLLSGASEDIETLGRAGEEMGYVFDIQDDIIDTLASRKDYGREPGSDLKTLKRPVHIILALEGADPDTSKKLTSPEVDLDAVKDILKETGALDRAGELIEERRNAALELLGSTGMDRESKDRFDSLMDYMGDSLKWYRAKSKG